MIAEVGHFALALALAMSLLGATVPHYGLHVGDARFYRLADRLAKAQFFMVAVGFAALVDAFLISDFSLKVVATNSHTAKPLIYKLSGVLGNHEGSLLFWVVMLTFFAAAISFFGRRLPETFRARVLAVQSFLIFGFLLFILLTSNPFERVFPAPAEGLGLNPLLQDPGLVFHPPMLYLGYVGLSVAFSFAIAALIDGQVTPLWARWVRPWTLAAWIFLTGGISLGSWWAYYELGWGGWWFWDPGENSSFMPWLAATALLHSAIVVEKRDALKSWTILLAIVAFSFSLLGAFLMRSGVLVSVHAFATDPERGLFILGFLAVVIGGSLSLYAWRARSLAGGGLFSFASRESALVLNNVLLATYAVVVLVGTLYPLVLEAVSGNQISVGPPFFNFASAVLMAPLVVALGVGPLLAWKRAKLGRAAVAILPVLVVALISALVLAWQSGGKSLMSALGLGLAVYLMAASLFEFAQRTKLVSEPKRIAARLKAVTRAQWGMTAAHFGLGLAILGIAVSETFTQEKIVALNIGDEVVVGDFLYRFDGVEPHIGPNYSAVRGHFTVFEDGREIARLNPEDRRYSDPVTQTTEAAIRPLFTGDLYAVVGEGLPDGRWSVRLYFKPFVSALWVGAIMMMIGGLLSLFDRRLRIGVPKGRKGAGPVSEAKRRGALAGAPEGALARTTPAQGTVGQASLGHTHAAHTHMKEAGL